MICTMLVIAVLLFAVVQVDSDVAKLSLYLYVAEEWKTARSKAMAIGTRMDLRCSLPSNQAINGPVKLTRKAYIDGNVVEVKSTQQFELNYTVPKLQLNDSGIYACIFGSFSEVFTLNVYELQYSQNITIPTQRHFVYVAHISLIERQLDHEKYHTWLDTGSAENGQFWMSCNLTLGSSDLDSVTIHWHGGLFSLTTNQTELAGIYTVIISKQPQSGRICTKLRLNYLIADQRVYGKYTCMFSLHKGENIFGTIFLNVPPILRLQYDPPPLPPINSTPPFTCPSPCHIQSSLDRVTSSFDGIDAPATQWESACTVLAAYPPTDLSWAWNRPSLAEQTVRTVMEQGKESLMVGLNSAQYIPEEEYTDDVYPSWVLERRRRSIALDHQINSTSAVPVIFWCWAKNQWGETSVWWPGSVKAPTFTWVSVWWPLLGVTLELIGLTIVFVSFYYCCHKSNYQWRRLRRRRGWNSIFHVDLAGAPNRQENIPFHPLTTGGVTSAATILPSRVCNKFKSVEVPLAAVRQVPYSRLSLSGDMPTGMPASKQHTSTLRLKNNEEGCVNFAIEADDVSPTANLDRVGCPVAIAASGDTELGNGEEYFWDSDAEGTPSHLRFTNQGKQPGTVDQPV